MKQDSKVYERPMCQTIEVSPAAALCGSMGNEDFDSEDYEFTWINPSI